MCRGYRCDEPDLELDGGLVIEGHSLCQESSCKSNVRKRKVGRELVRTSNGTLAVVVELILDESQDKTSEMDVKSNACA
jgi:hypothetical protein